MPEIKDGNFKQEKKPGLDRSETWIIDDNDRVARAMLRHLRGTYPDQRFVHFQTGAASVAEIKRRAEIGEPLPASIIVDGNLDADIATTPIWSKGERVVAELRKIASNPELLIIAHSSDEDSNDRMVSAGASQSVSKGETERILDLLKTVIEKTD